MLQVRPGTAQDEDAALALWTAERARRELRSGGSRAQQLRDRLRSPRALLLVAQDSAAGARVEGALLLEIEGRSLEVGLLVARPGTTAARALLASAASRFPALAAWTEDPGPYELAGFTATGEQRDGEAGTEVRLERRTS